MKYTAINIGPIIDTLSMGRRPRELWSASYMFSFLMECIIKEIKKDNTLNLISPAVIEGNNKSDIGLYPDRVFFSGENITDDLVNNIISKAFVEFKKVTPIGEKYINTMHVTLDDNDDPLIKSLNQLLDCTELFQRPTGGETYEKVAEFITDKKSKLITTVLGKDRSIPTLAEIATANFSNNEHWKEWKKLAIDDKTDEFYSELRNAYGKEFHSLYKYICVVQADGDNMGKIVSSVSADRVMEVSKALVEYGKSACEKVKEYGGLPIYAGGDDLLFIAPVRGKGNKNIFNLIDEIDTLYKEKVDKSVENYRPDGIHTTLSYGVAISYYKYPLYETFKSALSLLFDEAKKTKDTVAWQLRKSSGSGFSGNIKKESLNTENSETIYTLFKELANIEVDEKQVSAIAHKLRINEDLLAILRQSDDIENRIEQFYKKVMEESNTDNYKKMTRTLLCKLLPIKESNNLENTDISNEEHEKNEVRSILENMYSILRTAKFIKGEGDNDE